MVSPIPKYANNKTKGYITTLKDRNWYTKIQSRGDFIRPVYTKVNHVKLKYYKRKWNLFFQNKKKRIINSTQGPENIDQRLFWVKRRNK